MHNNDIRLIAMDMDGTLLNSSQQISRQNAQTLRLAAQQGIQIAICSGRATADIGLFARENQLDDCALLALNGTNIWLRPDGAELASHVMTEETLQATFKILWDAGILFTCFSQNDLVVLHDDEGDMDHVWLAHAGAGLKLYHGTEGMRRVQSKGINKIVCVFKRTEQLEPVRRQLTEVAGLEVSSSWVDNLELMPAGFNKGTAVAELAGHLGLTPAQVMTFGDFDNDLPMIEWADWGIAMGNANDRVKAAAKLTTLTNDEDGVAWAIRQYALKTNEKDC